MAAQRKGSAVWNGDLATGNGTVSFVSSRALPDTPVTWASRSEPATGGNTSPEELIAAAHAACFCMGLAAGLGRAGYKPDRLEAEATASFEKGDDGFSITSMALRLRARIPGIDEAAFQQAADAASKGCPVSKALAGNVRITLDATLE
jgi:osmotically inducible protein OsmC